MKKFLLGTTAVVAVTAFGGAAYAQSASEPIKLGLGGYWRGAAGDQIGGSGSGANQGRLKQQFQQDSLIIVSGTTKFDNGLNVGVSVQFRGEGANSVNETLQKDGTTVKGGQDTVKRSYVRFFGDFGEVRFGDDEDARMQKSFTAPQAGSIFGVNTPFLIFTNNPVGTNSTEAPITVKRSERIAYFSPTIAGFSFAASYSPTSQKGILAPIAFQSTTGSRWRTSLAVMVGRRAYDNKFGDFRLQAFGGLTGARTIGGGFITTTTFTGGATTTATTTTAAGSGSNQNQFVWNGGVNVGWGPIQVGCDVRAYLERAPRHRLLEPEQQRVRRRRGLHDRAVLDEPQLVARFV